MNLGFWHIFLLFDWFNILVFFVFLFVFFCLINPKQPCVVSIVTPRVTMGRTEIFKFDASTHHLRSCSSIHRTLVLRAIDFSRPSTVEPLWKGQECLTKVTNFGPFSCTILYKSCLFYPSWQATSFERPSSWAAFREGFHCIWFSILVWMYLSQSAAKFFFNCHNLKFQQWVCRYCLTAQQSMNKRQFFHLHFQQSSFTHWPLGDFHF